MHYYEVTFSSTKVAISKFLAVSVFFGAAYLWNDIMTGVAMYRGPQGPGWIDPKENRYIPPGNDTRYWAVLPDVGFDLLPYLKYPISTWILVGFMFATFLRFLFDKNNVRVLMRFMFVDGVLLVMRGFTVVATSMNNPWPGCYNCGSTCPTTVWGAVWKTLKKFPFFDCGDLMFSGHTVHFLLCSLIWNDYQSSKVLKVLVWMYSVPGIATLIANRYHYTNDVLIAAILLMFVWNWYHLTISHYKTVAASKQSLLSRFILWIEDWTPPAESSQTTNTSTPPSVNNLPSTTPTEAYPSAPSLSPIPYQAPSASYYTNISVPQPFAYQQQQYYPIYGGAAPSYQQPQSTSNMYPHLSHRPNNQYGY